MPSILFTDLSLQKLKWNGQTTYYWDTKTPSFGIRVGAQKKTWVIIQGKDRKVTSLGFYPHASLQDTKKKAKLELLTPAATKPRLSYEKSVEQYLEAIKGRVKTDTHSQYRSYLESFDFLNLPPTKDEITEGLKLYAGKPFAQNYAYVSLRAFLNWCLDEEYIDKHPLMRGKLPNKTRRRERVLSDSELGRVWRCTGDDIYGRILRLILLTGQRRIEVRNLKPEDVADELVTYRTKGDKTNVLPLTPLVKQNLTLPFKFNNWSTAKARFDAECGVEFQQRDLRRTLATKLAEKFGIDFVVIDRILGHAQTGVAFTYNRHDYLREAKRALTLYEEFILTVAKGEEKLAHL